MAETLISPGISLHETDLSAIAPKPIEASTVLIGPTVKGPALVPTKVTSYNEYVRIFGDLATVSGSTSTPPFEFMTSIAARSFFEQRGESLLVSRVGADDWTGAISSVTSSYSTSVITASFKLNTIGVGKIMNSSDTNGGYYTGSDGSLTYGTSDNLRYEIRDVDSSKGTFSLVIRQGDDTTKEKKVLETWTNLSLDPFSSNYIAARIGDQKKTVVNEAEGVYLTTEGDYVNNSKYVYVSDVLPTPHYLNTDGITVGTSSNGLSYSASLPRSQEGAFYSASGSLTGSIALFENIASNTAEPQGVPSSSVLTALALLENTDDYQFKVISAPGSTLGSGRVAVTQALTSLAETRGDCIAVPDIAECTSTDATAIQNAASVNSSYVATYWPWLQMPSVDGTLRWVPASVVIPGVYAYNDMLTAPWYAPAGLTRGGIQGVVQTRRKLTKGMRDALYEKNINPIATLPGTGIVIYGQKTLQKKASALDRVNVRRLLIELKKRVKDMASGLLFEQNTTALQNSFRSQLDSYLSSIVQRNGLYAYKIDLDGNTSDTIDRNEFHCAIYLQPTKVIEFVYLDFVVTATGVEFN